MKGFGACVTLLRGLELDFIIEGSLRGILIPALRELKSVFPICFYKLFSFIMTWDASGCYVEVLLILP
jgi:hypothetical protein